VDLDRPSVKRKLELISRHFAQQGRAYRVITEREIRREPLHGNLQRLWDALRAAGITCAVHSALDVLSPQQQYTLSSLVPLLGGERTVYALIAMGRLRTNMEELLCPTSAVWLAENTEAGDGSFSI
jgi:hypothetical protein